MSLYNKRGVSAQKEEVHAAVQNLNQGLFANAFCKVYPDFLGHDENFINVMHADGARCGCSAPRGARTYRSRSPRLPIR